MIGYVGLAAALAVGGFVPGADAPRVLADIRVVDGDTIAADHLTVRVIGIDTPEVGQCGFRGASKLARRLLADGASLYGFAGTDRYERTLASVRLADGRDFGAVMIRRGRAIARYDATDGYAWHPQQVKYHRIDSQVDHRCGAVADDPGSAVRAGGQFPNCAAAQAAGASPVRIGDPGYGPHLDADGDGVACEWPGHGAKLQQETGMNR